MLLQWKVFLAYALAVILWASAFPGIRAGLESYGPLHLALLRMLIGALGLLVFAISVRMKLPDKKDLPIIFLLGFLGFSVYHTFLSIGEMTVDAGTASLLVSTTPLLSAILAGVFLKEKFNRWGWIGSFVAFSGVALITFGMGGEFRLEIGALIILLAALGESFYFVFQSSYLKKYGFLPFTTYTILAGTLFMLIFSPGLWTAVQNASIESTITVIYLGLLPTVVPYFAIAYATSVNGASEATSTLYLTPVLSIIIAWIWLGEVPTVISIIGGALTLIGVSFTTIKGAKQDVEERPPAYAERG
ncbi:DMT family transporter [Salicibibacter kimchii]|uniref:DMT family transporter n=1 Tax=Salicibibacter kimchii TaxID=2099786 RepID=UPI001D04A2EA|nr:DMT family transporter [Salicibibacter kimchii]